jgi:hypothetical protein
MLGIGCPDRHALPRITLSKMRRPRRVLPSRASGFVLRPKAVAPATLPSGAHAPLPTSNCLMHLDATISTYSSTEDSSDCER